MHQHKSRVITVQVRRGSGDESHLVVYEVPLKPGQSVLGVLQYIYDHLDPTLAFSCSCRIGLCSACLVRVNGEVARACTTVAEGDMLIEPYSSDTRIKDLVARPPLLAKHKPNDSPSG